MSELIGGKYTTTAYIGIPGRVDAYEASDPTGVKVALMTAVTRSQADIDRFAGRAQAAATIVHPDVAKVTDWGSDGDTFYAAEEWVLGTDLKSELDHRGVPYSGTMTARFGVQIAAALSVAHARAIVHGDLRPDDIILIEPDDVKLVGLGAPTTGDAVAFAQDVPARAAHYISPEQARGGAPTASSDIYSLGAVLYHLATGSVPFDGASGAEVAAMHADRQVESPRRVNPEIPASLEAVIMKAMQKDATLRYRSAEEMRAALEQVTMGGAAGATSVMPVVTATPTKKKSPWGWILGLLAVVVLIAGAWYFVRGDIEVPDLSGMTLEQAQAAIEGAGLTLGQVGYKENYPDDVTEGTVFEQSPAAGDKARDEAKVDVTLAGNELVDVPDVVGMAESEAVLAIRDAGFQVGSIERAFDPDVDSGSVISQVPSTGTQAPADSPITITVSKGTETLTVPGVTGQTQDAATTALEAAGLVVRITEDNSDSVAEGLVISQDPSAGVTVETGTEVTLVVSLGPAPVAQVRVPTLVGLSEADAVAEVEALGLVADVITTADPANVGKVVAQDPAKDTMVDAGSTVEITVGE